MRSQLIATSKLLASVTISASNRRLALITTIAFFGSTTASFAAYAFLNETSNLVPGNGAVAQFTGTNGVINVSHNFPSGGVATNDNGDNLLSLSQFTTVFPGTGTVKGHLLQTVYTHTSSVTFTMTGYTITPDTIFGIWNTTDEVTAPVGGNPVYRVQLINASNVQVNPSTFGLYGRQDNTGASGVPAKHEMNMAPNGDITFGTLINPSGTHTDATFWKGIPPGTKQIIVSADLPPLNTVGDGVGFYFAELVVPEPCSFALCVFGLFSLTAFRRRRSR